MEKSTRIKETKNGRQLIMIREANPDQHDDTRISFKTKLVLFVLFHDFYRETWKQPYPHYSRTGLDILSD